MSTHMKGKRTFEDMTTEKVDWQTISIVNDLLKEARIDAKFSTQDEQVKDMNEIHEGTRVTLEVMNFDRD